MRGIVDRRRRKSARLACLNQRFRQATANAAEGDLDKQNVQIIPNSA